MRRKPNLAARIDKCAHLLVNDPAAFRGRWLSELPYDELHIELGCGKGRFTVETARVEPDVMLVALEKSLNVLITALENAASYNLENVRFVNALADNLIEFFAQNEVSRIYINFCDPWPGSKHAKRRLTGQRFLEFYHQILQPGGEIHLKTDNLPLFEFSLREFERCGFVLAEVVRNLHESSPVSVMTDYELKFHEQGIVIYKCITLKKSLL